MELPKSEISDFQISLDALCDAFNAKGIFFTQSEVEDSLRCCIAHHVRHLMLLGINQASVDPFKIVTWWGVDLARRIEDTDRRQTVIACTIATLNAILNRENPNDLKPFAEGTLRYIKKLAFNELSGNGDHGIGKNGLFLCFHSAQRVKRALQ